MNQTLESPRQIKLDHDVTAILGSSDPPPGFGFLHPRFYYLEQKRPIPLEPLQVSISFYCKKKEISSSEKEINLYSIVTIPNPFSFYIYTNENSHSQFIFYFSLYFLHQSNATTVV